MTNPLDEKDPDRLKKLRRGVNDRYRGAENMPSGLNWNIQGLPADAPVLVSDGVIIINSRHPLFKIYQKEGSRELTRHITDLVVFEAAVDRFRNDASNANRMRLEFRVFLEGTLEKR